jgi:hypothetical protein
MHYHKFCAHVHTDPGPQQAYQKIGNVSLSRRQSGRGVMFTTHPQLAPSLQEKQSYSCIPLRAFMICCRVKYALEYNNRMVAILYSVAPHNDISVNDRLHMRRWSHKIIL